MSKILTTRNPDLLIAELRKRALAHDRLAATVGAKVNHSYTDLAIRLAAQGDALGLSRMLWKASGTGMVSDLKAANFDSRYAAAMPMSNQRQVWVALYWPGATMNGFAFDVTMPGVYTDAGSAYWLYTSDGTNLTPVANAGGNAPAAWKDAAGLRTRSFGAPFPQVMAEGVYYMSILYSQSAQTTAPQLLGLNPTDFGPYTGQGSNVMINPLYPANWQPVYNLAGVVSMTSPPAVTAITAVNNTTLTNYPWLGLW